MPDYQCRLAGISFAVREQPELENARPSGSVSIRVDPTNKYAKHPRGAFVIEWNGFRLGYLSDAERGLQDEVIRALDAGEKVTCEVASYSYKDGNEFNDNHVGILGSVAVSVHTDSEVPASIGEQRLVSMNEPGVELAFDPAGHIYRHLGRPMVSVTKLVAAMYEPFDKHTIASRCAKSWGMKASDIVEMWELNGKSASDFGSAVHTCIEAYEKFGERALPKMNVLREIVQSFPFKEGLKVHAEAVVTCVRRGICGMADRIIVTGDGVHYVTDIKVQSEVEEEKSSGGNLIYPDLPKNKLSKHRCQMSIYAQMLEESGLKVGGKVAAIVFDGEWKTFSMDRIEGILDELDKKA